jgi:hypothetical protein
MSLLMLVLLCVYVARNWSKIKSFLDDLQKKDLKDISLEKILECVLKV